ncbi:MAG: AMP-dependent synthetase/ligase [Sandaracinaceae bacterium]
MTERRTLLQHIRHWSEERPDRAAFHELRPDGEWDISTWRDVYEVVRAVGKGLITLGLEPKESVALVGNNRREWLFSQHGITAAAGVPGPLYTTLLTEQMAYIIGNCQAKIGICDTQVQLDKLLAIRAKGDTPLQHIVTMDDLGSTEPDIITFQDLVERGRAQPDDELDRRIEAVDFDDVALLIYTSGTTGLPKGAMFTHRSIDRTSTSTIEVYKEVLNADIRYISYLPLCHAAEQGVTNFCGVRAGGRIYFCPDITKIRDYLEKVRPTVFFAVPRVWEKFEAALRGRLAEAKGLRAGLVSWALKTEKAAIDKEREGHRAQGIGRALANRLVQGKIKTTLGLEEVRFAASGAAPISRSTLDFFASLGIMIHEGYGMTETTAFATVQPYQRARFGTVGQALPGVEIRIADDGEILLRGDNMVPGYLRLPEKTAELYTDEWMHTGDLGQVDEQGYLSITGRKKDLLITAGGKNVAPAEMEAYLQAIPGVGQAVVVGDQKPYLAALLVLDPEALPALAKAANVELRSAEEMANDPQVLAFFKDRVDEDCNTKVARYQTIKKFEVLAEPFTIEGGELTPTMKVKRNVVGDKYGAVIEGLYATDDRPAQARA